MLSIKCRAVGDVRPIWSFISLELYSLRSPIGYIRWLDPLGGIFYRDLAWKAMAPGPPAAYTWKWLMLPYYPPLGGGFTGATQLIVARFQVLAWWRRGLRCNWLAESKVATFVFWCPLVEINPPDFGNGIRPSGLKLPQPLKNPKCRACGRWDAAFQWP